LNATGLDYQLDIYKSRLGHEGKNVAPLGPVPAILATEFFRKTD
jgi:hypothetical protein